MRAVLFDGQVKYVDDYPRPILRPSEAVVRVRLAGICNTDQEIVRGYMGFGGVLGHEFVGLVEECAEEELIGARVVGEINCPCGTCPVCQRGDGNHCPSRTVLGIHKRDGAFADYLSLPTANLHLIPPEISDLEAVFVEPLAACFEITQQICVGQTDDVVVLGDGKLGLLAAQVLAMHSSRVLVAGKHPSKLALLDDLGIETRLTSEVPGRIADVVVECTGSAAGLEMALGILRPRGTVVLKSTVAGACRLNLSPLVVDEITVVGSRCGPFEPAIEALRTRQISVMPLVTETYPLEEAPRAFQRASEPSGLKVLLRVS